jgi:hypothetical protein
MEPLTEHRELLGSIQELFTTYHTHVIKQSSFNTKQQEIFNTKLAVFYNNLTIIKENIIDLYTDLDTTSCILPPEIDTMLVEHIQLNQLCKEVFPIIFPYILLKNSIA